jgi:hypothetical protein
MQQGMKDFVPPVVEAPQEGFLHEQVRLADAPKPMTEEEYAHLLQVEEDEKLSEMRKAAATGKPLDKFRDMVQVKAKDPVTGLSVLNRVPPEAAQYLGNLRACPAARLARDAAGVSAAQVAGWRKNIAGFAEMEREAGKDAADALFASCYNRATHGVLKPVYQMGHLVGYEREYSDKLAELLLKGMKKEMFEDKEEKGSVTNQIVLTDANQIAEIVRKLSPTSRAELPAGGGEKVVQGREIEPK